MKISGREIASKILNSLEKNVTELKEKGILPNLAVILVGEDPASLSFIKQKQLAAEKIGTKLTQYNFPTGTDLKVISHLLQNLNVDNKVHGIIIQRPVPQIQANELIKFVLPQKDVDGFLPNSPYQPPVGLAVMYILQDVYYKKINFNKDFSLLFDSNLAKFFSGKKIVLLGRGETAGSPIAKVLHHYLIPFTVIHSQTPNPENLIKSADLIISAVGKERMLNKEDIKSDAILIGVGMRRINEKLAGDYYAKEIEDNTEFYTPTPGGVGPVNVACLIRNLVSAASIQN